METVATALALPNFATVKSKQQVHGPRVITPSSGPRCKSSVSPYAKHSTCAPDKPSSTSPPATAMPPWPLHGAGRP